MKYGIMLAISLLVMVIVAGNLAEGNGSAEWWLVEIASILGCAYSEYKLGFIGKNNK